MLTLARACLLSVCRPSVAAQIRLLDLNVLRWRYGRNALGEEMIESNARFVRWSDGSLQLQVGSETLDVSQQDVARDQSHLFVRHPGAGIIQAQAHMRSKLVFRPSSLQSKSHKLLTAAIDKRHQRVVKVKKVVTSVDPDAEKTEREKAEQRRVKDTETLARKQGVVAHRYGLDSRQGGLLSRDFLEGDDGAARPLSLITRMHTHSHCMLRSAACLASCACCMPRR
jgi:RNA polymerase-associated protein LEO1